MAKKSALGKGLGALISGYEGTFEPHQPKVVNIQPEAPTSISEIPIEKITANPYQPRTMFEEEALAELAESIKQLGVIQPITVRSLENGSYQIISGERRYRAAKMAGLLSIPAYIRNADDQGMLEMAIVENIQRENLDAIEVAISFQRLIEECRLTQEAMADRVGKKRATVTNYLRLLKLPAKIQLSLREGKISMGHAKCILSLNEVTDQLVLCEQIIKEDLSVRQTEQRVKSILNPVTPKEKKPVNLPDQYYRVLEIVGRYFNNNISLKRSDKGKGSITIQFANDQEIEKFLKDLEGIKS